MSEQKRPSIYYVYDALCGWCYGFSDVISEFHEKYKDQFDFQVFSGGMVTGEREGSVGEVAGYIKTAYKNVEETTGVTFGENFLSKTLEEGTAYFSSVPAALAMALFRSQNPDKAIEFAKSLQKAIYFDGLPPAEFSTFSKCAEDFGFDGQLFIQKMEDPTLQKLIQEEFKVVANWGIKGFPSIIYKEGNNAFMIARGYTPSNMLEETLNNVRAQIRSGIN